MKRLLLVCLFCVGCGAVPVAPTPATVPPTPFAYAINVPDTQLAQTLRAYYPQGVHVSPIEAQAHFDYTATYGGTPNVYYGPVAPPCQSYVNTSIIIAPQGAAGKRTFTSVDWPGAHLDSGVTYEWVGGFEVAYPALPGSYVPCITR